MDELSLDPWSGSGVGGVPIGPQSDGTYGYPTTIPSPVDAGGGAPAGYMQSVLDVFKFGVGTYAARQNTKDLLEYKRFEATQQGLAQQGIAARFNAINSSGGMNTMLIVGAAVLVGVLLLRKG